jgi:hypothetical protein
VRITTDGDIVPLVPLYTGRKEAACLGSSWECVCPELIHACCVRRVRLCGRSGLAGEAGGLGVLSIFRGALHGVGDRIGATFNATPVGGVLDPVHWLHLVKDRLAEAIDSMVAHKPASYHHAGNCLYLRTTAICPRVYE